MQSRVVHPPKVVEVLRDGTWWLGQLDGWQRRDDGWWGHLRYYVGVGLQHLEVVPADEVRPIVRRGFGQ